MNPNLDPLLLQACKDNDVEQVQYLLENGADPNAQDHIGNIFYYTLKYGGFGLYGDFHDDDDPTDFCIWVKENHDNIMNILVLLLEANADLKNFPVIDYATEMRLMCYDHFDEIIKFLIINGAEFENSNILLILTYNYNDISYNLLEYLLKVGVNANKRDSFNNTALIQICRSVYQNRRFRNRYFHGEHKDQHDKIKILMQYTDLSIQNDENITAVDYIRRLSHNEELLDLIDLYYMKHISDVKNQYKLLSTEDHCVILKMLSNALTYNYSPIKYKYYKLLLDDMIDQLMTIRKDPYMNESIALDILEINCGKLYK